MQTVARYSHQGCNWSESFVTIPGGNQMLAAVFLEPVEIPRRGSFLLCGSVLDQRKYLYRDIVRLSRTLVREGFAVLRFDYRGFGESSGFSWLTCLADCIDDATACFSWIQAQQPEYPIICMGIALGALIAAHTATRVGATSLVACQPLWSVETGHQRPQWTDLTPMTSMTDYAGYGINKQFYAQVVSHDRGGTIINSTTGGNRRALILSAASGMQSATAKLYAEQLASADFAVSMQTLNAQKFWLSTDLAMPVEQISQLLGVWLAELPTNPSLTAHGQESGAEQQENCKQSAKPGREENGAALFLYQDDVLVEARQTPVSELVETRTWLPLSTGGTLALSIVTPLDLPQRDEKTRRRGVMLLPTTGLRSGPHDIYVHFSRQLAASGLTCMRFDYSYYGDGQPATQQPWQLHLLYAEAESAVRFFCEQFELDELILLGLCTGGEFALSLSRLFPQVIGCVLWSTDDCQAPAPCSLNGTAIRTEVFLPGNLAESHHRATTSSTDCSCSDQATGSARRRKTSYTHWK
jgi:pimeloyl-ACP methyl ester carboxylesterase